MYCNILHSVFWQSAVPQNSKHAGNVSSSIFTITTAKQGFQYLNRPSVPVYSFTGHLPSSLLTLRDALIQQYSPTNCLSCPSITLYTERRPSHLERVNFGKASMILYYSNEQCHPVSHKRSMMVVTPLTLKLSTWSNFFLPGYSPWFTVSCQHFIPKLYL